MNKSYLVICIVGLVCASSVIGATLNVPSEYGTIQAAINAAADGDTVLVVAGTYYEKLSWYFKSIALVGAGADATIVDAGGGGTCLYMYQVSDTAVVEGFTFTGGSAPYGAGLYLISSSPTLMNNVIRDNSSNIDSGGGGGLYLRGSSPALINNTVTGNWARFGGGLDLYYSSPTLTNNTITGNKARSNGGGLYLYASSPILTMNTIAGNVAQDGGGLRVNESCPMLMGNTISGNSAWYGGGLLLDASPAQLIDNQITDNTSERCGGGLYLVYSSATLTSNTISGNSSPEGGGIFMASSSPMLTNNIIVDNSASYHGGGLYLWLDSSPTLTNNTIAVNAVDGLYNTYGNPFIMNCILWGNGGYDLSNASATYSVIGTGELVGEGNISVDPMFVGDGDYHLQDGSPCIDAGSNSALALPDTDKDGNPRIIGYAVDMGAYESQVPLNRPPVGDAGSDQIVQCACQTPGGTKVTLDGSGSYDPDGDLLTYTWTGQFAESPASGPTTTVTLDPGCLGTYPIILVVNDGNVDSEPDTVQITVVDTTPPTIICPETITVEAQSPSGVPSSDPDILTFLTEVSASDKCDPSPETTDDAPVEFPLGDTIVTFSSTDAQNNSSSCQATVMVQDTTPPEISIHAPEPYGLYPVGSLALDFSAYDLVSGNIEPPALSGTLTDAAGFSGPVVPGDVPGAGVYTLVVCAEDEAENYAESEPVFFVIYDPEGGFVTGGGWIESPEGAYRPDPSLTGKANFGFVSKYKKGAATPTGNTEFVFKAGDLNFHSSSYDWLVVTGSNYARFKGTGIINGYGEYRFMLWAGDNPDTFRIRIWEEDDVGSEFDVYDNGFDQDIMGGNIIIHTN